MRPLLIASVCVFGLSATASLAGQRPRIIGVDDLNIYGTSIYFTRDNQVPGGATVWMEPRIPAGDAWSIGTGTVVPIGVHAGQQVTGAFWARAEQPLRVTATIHGTAPDGRNLAMTSVVLIPRWQRFTLQGVAPSQLSPGSQFLSLAMGEMQGKVELGPVLFMTGQAGDARIAHGFATFRPRSIAEDVSIVSEPGVTLAGRLRLPGHHGAGPFPAVLLLSGSGPGQRGGFPLLEQRLLDDGIAVLTYDKRGVGQSTGRFIDTLGNMETDAAAALRFLRGRRDIDAARIALAGHSQGGAVGPAVAAQDPAIAAVVMFAGPAASPTPPGPGHELNLVLLKNALIKGGADPAAVEQVTASVERLFEAEIREAPKSEIMPLQESVLQAYMACRFNRQQAEAALEILRSIILEAFQAHFDQKLARLRMPVLALYGSCDVIVPPADNLPAARQALAANPRARVIEIADMDHNFHHVERASPEERRYPGPVAAPEVLALVSDWLIAQLHPPRAR